MQRKHRRHWCESANLLTQSQTNCLALFSFCEEGWSWPGDPRKALVRPQLRMRAQASLSSKTLCFRGHVKRGILSTEVGVLYPLSLKNIEKHSRITKEGVESAYLSLSNIEFQSNVRFWRQDILGWIHEHSCFPQPRSAQESAGARLAISAERVEYACPCRWEILAVMDME